MKEPTKSLPTVSVSAPFVPSKRAVRSVRRVFSGGIGLCTIDCYGKLEQDNIQLVVVFKDSVDVVTMTFVDDDESPLQAITFELGEGSDFRFFCSGNQIFVQILSPAVKRREKVVL